MHAPPWLTLMLDRARTSYFMIPAIAGVTAFWAAIGTLAADRGGLPFSIPVPVEEMEDARSLLTTIATSSIGAASTVFSITIVVLSLASSQFGPRLLRNFLKNRSSQIVLGLFVATHVYCLVAMRTASSAWDVPQLTCLVALALAILEAAALVYFIHHTAEWIQVSRVIDVVGDRLEIELARQRERMKHAHDAELWRPRLGAPDCLVRAGRSGYLTGFDDRRLYAIAKKNDIVVERRIPAGDFVFDGLPIAAVWGEVDPDVIDDIIGCFDFGDARTEIYDPFHLLDQLIELALRALSPGVNDPVTAVECIDRVANSLLPILRAPWRTADELAKDPLAPQTGLNEGDRPSLIVQLPDIAKLCDRAFGEIRRAGRDQYMVTSRLERVLPVLIEAANDPKVRRELEHEREKLERFDEKR